MKNKNKSLLKTIALIVAVLLIGIILSVTNAFVGNPISSAFAKVAIKEYVQENYSDLDLEIGKVQYNFKDSSYIAKAKSRTSVDTYFSIYCRNGEITWDEYSSVLNKFNTLRRLENEYTDFVIPILSKVPGLENNRAMVMIEKWEYEMTNENITLDMEFNKNLPIDMKINIRADLQDISLKSIASTLENAHQTLLNNGCTFISYDIFSESNGTLVMINDVTPEDIEGGNLEKLLEDALNYEEEDHQSGKDKEQLYSERKISVYIKYNTK